VFGESAVAMGQDATVVGQGSFALDADATVVGQGVVSVGSQTTAVGQASFVGAQYASAYGYNANANGYEATAVGSNSSADYSNSASFGYGAQATRVNQQVFGTYSNTYTMPGITSWQSTAAQSGQLGLVTSDASGNLASDPGLYNQIGKNREGIAMAMAMGGFYIPEHKSMSAALNFGTWDGAWAVAGNFGGRVSDSFSVSGAVSVSETGLIGARAGGQLSW